MRVSKVDWLLHLHALLLYSQAVEGARNPLDGASLASWRHNRLAAVFRRMGPPAWMANQTNTANVHIASLAGRRAADNNVPAQTLPQDTEVATVTVVASATSNFAQLSTTAVIQSLVVPTEAGTTGSIITDLTTSQSQPIASAKTDFDPNGLPAASQTSFPVNVHLQEDPASVNPGNMFAAFATDAPTVPSKSTHPISRDKITKKSGALTTNKFYANLFLGGQTNPVFTFPYTLSWSKGTGNAKSWGIAISHIEKSMLSFGPILQPQNAVQYYINPLGIQHLILSSAELGSSTVLTVDEMGPFSATVRLAPAANAAVLMTFPVSQGMGFITAQYSNATPLIGSSVFFRTLQRIPTSSSSMVGYKIQLEDSTYWLLYVIPSRSGYAAQSFTLKSRTAIQGPAGFTGVIQVTKLPVGKEDQAQPIFDQSAGVYTTGASLAATTHEKSAAYQIIWSKAGDLSRTPIVYALPHHIDSFDSSMNSANTTIQLLTTVKGVGTAIKANSWLLVENDLPTDMGFNPYIPGVGSINQLSNSAITAINSIAATELKAAIVDNGEAQSMYYSGKALARAAMIVWTLYKLTNNPTDGAAGLQKLKDAIAVYINNQQPNPLVYDTVWGGVVSTAGYTDSGADFGNTYYNDHHFHFGYHVYAAAVIAAIDPTWLKQGTNAAWVNMLVRDFASPVADDYYPFCRAFDFYHGHSWAKGLFESGDGKDQESSSEDGFAAYALKMWGLVTGDGGLEARGNLMLGIQRRTFKKYILMMPGQSVQPDNFIPNHALGIMFENKCDHATYFGANPEYIEGIHMIPLSPLSAYHRQKDFVTSEWNTFFSNGRVDNVTGGWRALLYANLATIDPNTAWTFFTQANFDYSWLDGGASRTWYLAFTDAFRCYGKATC